MTIKKEFDYNILKINYNKIISANHHQVNAILYILQNDQK